MGSHNKSELCFTYFQSFIIPKPLVSVVGEDTQSAEDSKPKLHGSLAAIQEGSGTIRVYNYVEKSGDGKVIHSFSKGSKSVKGTAK